jgi:2,6-dihydroxypseudooxynicotine hydrolase
VDTDRLGAWGVSLGGYYVLRATAFEPRIRASISLSGPYDIRWDVVSPLSAKAFVLRTHSSDEEQAQERLRAMDLTGVLPGITVPVYIMGGNLDRIVQSVDQERMAAEIAGPVTFNMIVGGNHVASNKAYLYRPQSADWMREQLGA